MRVFVFSFLVFFISPIIFSETLTAKEVEAITRADPTRSYTERLIVLAAGQAATRIAPAQAKFYTNLVRAYAWVMNDMNTAPYSVYRLGPFSRRTFSKASISFGDTNRVTLEVISTIMGFYKEYGDEGFYQAVVLLSYFDDSLDMADENDPRYVAWIEQSKEKAIKIISLAHELSL